MVNDRAGKRANESDDRAGERARLVEHLERRDRVTDPATLEALGTVPRHEFVSPKHRDAAYDDRPLSIGENQTVSAPHMVGIMSDLLALASDDRVLEIGTGCGYHAAVTAELAGAVYSVEYHAELARRARERLTELGYDVAVRIGDGQEGWSEHAPYDAAYLTCAAPDLPEPIVEQVRPGGRIVAPVEERSVLGRTEQTLVRAKKHADGSLEREEHGGVRFVSMQRS